MDSVPFYAHEPTRPIYIVYISHTLCPLAPGKPFDPGTPLGP